MHHILLFASFRAVLRPAIFPIFENVIKRNKSIDKNPITFCDQPWTILSSRQGSVCHILSLKNSRNVGQKFFSQQMCSVLQGDSSIIEKRNAFPFARERSWDGRPVADAAVLHPHVDIAQKHWSKILSSGDTVIDATAGNGHDTLNLVEQISWVGGGTLTACDIQLSAIEASKTLLKDRLKMKVIEESPSMWLCLPFQTQPKLSGSVVLHWHHGCHLDFIRSLPPTSVKLVVFNLGYLPGGDKSIVTLSDTTVSTLREATAVLEPGGCISVTCYPGHAEGESEERAVVSFASSLPQQTFSSYWHQWINQRNKRTGKPAPSLVLIQRL
jgi:hypothetical protein